jgi:predicted amidohydrolase YtcJ
MDSKLYRRSLVIIMLAFGLNAHAQQADIILTNGKIFTSNQSQLYAEAVAIKGNKILSVGKNDEIQKLTAKSTMVINLQGRTVVPGFNDAHYHHSTYPKGHVIPYPGDGSEPSWQQLKDSIASAVKSNRPGTFIHATMGNNVGTDTSITRAVLDQLAPKHPLYISSYWGHVTYFNTAAIKALSISETAPDMKGGEFGRIPGTNKLNGRAYEYACVFLALRIPTTPQLFRASLADVGNQAVYFGVTTIQNMCTGASPETYLSILPEVSLPVRLRLIRWPVVDRFGHMLIPSMMPREHNDKLPLVTLFGTKWMLDGTPIERGAWYSTAYKDQPGWNGKLNFSKEQVGYMLSDLITRRDQPMFHVVGDSTIDFLLNELRNSKHDWSARRVRFEHGDGLLPGSYETAKKLNIIVVQNPSHFTIVDVLNKRYSAKLIQHAEPMKSLLKAGIPVAIGSDGPMNPYLNIMFACIHPFNPKEALTVEEAVIAYTKTAAYAEFSDDKGMLAPGQLADLVVLSQDIFSIPLQALPGTHSVLTMVNGKIIMKNF